VLPPPPPVAVAARVLIEQPTVSDQQLLLKSVHLSDSERLVREVKVNLIRCDIRGVGRE